MDSIGLKSFCVSFVLSLFAIFFVNDMSGDVSYSPSLPHKNIALFLKDNSSSLKKSPIALFKHEESIHPDAFPSEEFSLKKDELEPVAKPQHKFSEKTITTASVQSKPALAKVSLSKNTKKEIVSSSGPTIALPALTDDNIKNEMKPSDVSHEIFAEASSVKEKGIEPSVALPHKKAEHKITLAALDIDSEEISGAQPVLYSPSVSSSQISSSEKSPSKIGQLKDKENPLIPLEKEDVIPKNTSLNPKVNPDDAKHQVAMSDFNKPVSSMVASSSPSSSDVSSESSWKTMAQLHDNLPSPRPEKEIYAHPPVTSSLNDSPWIAAKGTKFPKNTAILDEDFYKNSDALALSDSLNPSENIKKSTQQNVKVAGEVVDNILIPIPEDILNDKNLMPNLVSDPVNKPLEDKLKEKEAQAAQKEILNSNTEEIPFIVEKKSFSTEKSPLFTEKADSDESEKGFFGSLKSLFSSQEDLKDTPLTDFSANEENISEEQIDEIDIIDDEASQNLEEVTTEKKLSPKTSSMKKNNKNLKILPSEIRLSFQNDRAEISGKTLDWVRAFAQKAIENQDVFLEIRIDGTSSFELQQKRLNLLYNILTNLGLVYAKVHTVFTNRDPNSFILRAVKTSEDSDKKPFDPASSYYSI